MSKTKNTIKHRGGRNATGPPTKYPWDRWLQRKTKLTLRNGKDFECKQSSMAVTIRKRLATLQIDASVFLEKNGDIQIVPRGRG